MRPSTLPARIPSPALAVLALLAWAAPEAQAQYPYLVENIHPTGSSNPTRLQDWNGRLAFLASTPAQGTELWVSDGTSAGTLLLLDAFPGADSGSATVAVGFAGLHYFAAQTGPTSGAIWSSDGTPAGTQVLIQTSEAVNVGTTVVHAALGSLFLRVSTPATGNEPFLSDGTPAGTSLLLDIRPGPLGSGFTRLGEVNGLLVFYANDGVHGYEPWVTDGSAAGTTLLADVRPGAAGSESLLPGEDLYAKTIGGRIVFAADDGIHGRELWSTDGTPAGTQLVQDFKLGPGGSSPNLKHGYALPTKVVLGIDATSLGYEPWVTDGTAAGTFLLGDMEPGPESSVLMAFPESGSGLARAALRLTTTLEGDELLLTDGTLAGTVLHALAPGPDDGLYAFGFVGAQCADKYVFVAKDPLTGNRLAVSDGTPGGTLLLDDIGIGEEGITLNALGDFVMGSHPTGNYYSDGQLGTTHNLTKPSGSSTNYFMAYAARVGSRVFFSGTPYPAPLPETELWAIDVDVDGDGEVNFFDALNLYEHCGCPAPTAPCGNPDASSGCANSTGQGAHLGGSGTTRLAQDDLVLQVSGMPAGQNGILFMGTQAVAPTPFVDGLRCAAGQLVRWPLQNSGAGGTFTYGPGLAAQSAVVLPPGFAFVAGQTRTLQAWYRDPASPCGTGSNVSDAATVVFTP